MKRKQSTKLNSYIILATKIIVKFFSLVERAIAIVSRWYIYKNLIVL